MSCSWFLLSSGGGWASEILCSWGVEAEKEKGGLLIVLKLVIYIPQHTPSPLFSTYRQSVFISDHALSLTHSLTHEKRLDGYIHENSIKVSLFKPLILINAEGADHSHGLSLVFRCTCYYF